MNYYEVVLKNENELSGEYSICIKGMRKPTNKEAEKFLEKDMKEFGYTYVEEVIEISHEEACAFFDMEKEETFPVFDKEENK